MLRYFGIGQGQKNKKGSAENISEVWDKDEDFVMVGSIVPTNPPENQPVAAENKQTPLPDKALNSIELPIISESLAPLANNNEQAQAPAPSSSPMLPSASPQSSVSAEAFIDETPPFMSSEYPEDSDVNAEATTSLLSPTSMDLNPPITNLVASQPQESQQKTGDPLPTPIILPPVTESASPDSSDNNADMGSESVLSSPTLPTLTAPLPLEPDFSDSLTLVCSSASQEPVGTFAKGDETDQQVFLASEIQTILRPIAQNASYSTASSSFANATTLSIIDEPSERQMENASPNGVFSQPKESSNDKKSMLTKCSNFFHSFDPGYLLARTFFPDEEDQNKIIPAKEPDNTYTSNILKRLNATFSAPPESKKKPMPVNKVPSAHKNTNASYFSNASGATTFAHRPNQQQNTTTRRKKKKSTRSMLP